MTTKEKKNDQIDTSVFFCFLARLNVEVCKISTSLHHLLSTIEKPLSLWLHIEELHDLQTQFIHFGEFRQGVHPVGFLPIHCAHLNPHCSCPLLTPT